MTGHHHRQSRSGNDAALRHGIARRAGGENGSSTIGFSTGGHRYASTCRISFTCCRSTFSSRLFMPTQLLRDVKESHQIDLAYLYYLPFCSVFTSKDRFHRQIVPLFLTASSDVRGRPRTEGRVAKAGCLLFCVSGRDQSAGILFLCHAAARRYEFSHDAAVGQISPRMAPQRPIAARFEGPRHAGRHHGADEEIRS